ncbi:hypothetical protein [Nitrosopumilus sp. Nsub]|uniref:hypothetical protein n=1 Tax=Nitrosopumilus sp. Nsub TaxID=1776294 RepID=UPI0008367F1B|nr:hypothetical protein [Nitrosopumilus sp. Nsub]
MVSLELDFPKDSKVDRALMEKLMEDFQKLSLKVGEMSFDDVPTKEVRYLIAVYMDFYQKASNLTTDEEDTIEKTVIYTMIMKLREGIMAMVSLVTSKLVGKLDKEIEELKKTK